MWVEGMWQNTETKRIFLSCFSEPCGDPGQTGTSYCRLGLSKLSLNSFARNSTIYFENRNFIIM